MRRKTYESEALKELALARSRPAGGIPSDAAGIVSPEPSIVEEDAAHAGEHGVEWGEDLHALLEAAMKFPDADLTSLARSVTRERDGDPERVDALVASAKAVTQSAIWNRARASERVLVEVPLIFQDAADEAGDPSLRVRRGVIDLVFLEPQGWVIVDYKTDLVQPGSIAKLVDHYRPQVQSYADAWQTLLEKTPHNKKVCELGLFFTRLDRYERL